MAQDGTSENPDSVTFMKYQRWVLRTKLYYTVCTLLDTNMIIRLFQINHPVSVWDPSINFLEKTYVLIHFPLIVLFYHELTIRNGELNQFIVTCGIVSLIACITSMGFLLEKRWFAPALEFLRCLLFFAIEQTIWPVVEDNEFFDLHRIYLIRGIRLTYLVSSIGCGVLALSRLAFKLQERMQKKKQVWYTQLLSWSHQRLSNNLII